MKTNQIRKTFLDYFAKNKHQIVDSSALVPQNDPTLMFTNAGMVQFKDLFTGLETRDYKTAVTSQKCVRAGGKHNDLENVGYTARHHTFFEMLGNFSFGDYFKENAIELAWNLLTKEYALDKDKLLVTVYHNDDEAVNYWKKIAGLKDDKIIRIATSDNFWQMGDTGPCGPCSEIFYDHGEDIFGGVPGSPDEDGDRFIEIWNLVFMQFEQMESGLRKDLPKPSIDTGMGLERISAILQGKHNNYDIDTFKNIIDYTAGIVDTDTDNVSLKVITDHLRSSAFLIADGVLPSNEGRGYVLRRIMRRAMRHAHILGAKDPLMYKLVPSLIKEMGQHFTELKDANSLITETLRLEETRFKETLDRGLKLLDSETEKMGSRKVLDGKIAFNLYDTYGFPVDLTADILRSKGKTIDMKQFDASMSEQKEKARSAWVGSGASKTDKLWFDVKDKVGSTEFLGYESTHSEGVIKSIVVDSKQVKNLSRDQEGVVITNQTPFYGESCGQVGDTGIIKNKNCKLIVIDTQKALGDLFLHYVKVKDGEVCVNDSVELIVDNARRKKIQANHSVTHLMHESLREILGDHISQKGSLQNEQITRFDVSNNSAISKEDIIKVENIVNQQIRDNTPIDTILTTPEKGREMGAQALFGEKYSDEVRVVSMGSATADKRAYSIELCGGTHCKSTGEIGGFKIINETAVSAGVRRIEAVTGSELNKYVQDLEKVINSLNVKLKSTTDNLPNKVKSLIDSNKKLEKEVINLRKKMASDDANRDNLEPESINGTNFIGQTVDLPAKELKGLADDLKSQFDNSVIVLISTNDEKVSIVVASNTDKHNAVELVKIASKVLGGKGGGGRPDMAQAGGSDASKVDEAISEIKKQL